MQETANGKDLRRISLEKANLVEADLEGCVLVKTNLFNAMLDGCEIYGISTWDVKINNKTSMKDLKISGLEGESVITVDNIEVAQFIYMLLDNQKIRSIIDQMRTKAVLILGSFDETSKNILEAIKDIVRKRGYLPLLFDFDPSETQFPMDTVRTMALLSNFVIVDLSVRSGQLYELTKLVPEVSVPFVIIARKETKLTGMLGDCSKYYWVQEEYFPYSLENYEKEIPLLFEEKMIPWANEINKQVMTKKQQANERNK